MKGTPVEQELFVSAEDWDHHCHVIGGTGSGKTNLLYHLMTQGEPYCFIDGEGISARAVADSMECIYWRARDYAFPVSLNILQDSHPDDRDELTGDIVALCWDIWDLGEHTPLLNDYLSAAIRLLLETQGSTLIELNRVLTDPAFRGYLLKRCRDNQTKEFWRTFNEKDKRLQDSQISSTLNKANALARSLPLRLALGQSTSTIDFRDIMATGKNVVIDLSGINKQSRRLLGAVITFHIVNLASKREVDAPQYSLIVDEFADFISGTAPEALSKSRKRHLSLTLAHQYILQLDEKVRAAIFANVGTFVCFRIGVDDAPIMAAALDTAEDNLKHQSRGNAWIRTLQEGRPHRAVPISIPKAKLETGHLERNIQTTRHRYARSRADAQYQLDWWQRVQWAMSQKQKPKTKEQSW